MGTLHCKKEILNKTKWVPLKLLSVEGHPWYWLKSCHRLALPNSNWKDLFASFYHCSPSVKFTEVINYYYRHLFASYSELYCCIRQMFYYTINGKKVYIKYKYYK